MSINSFGNTGHLSGSEQRFCLRVATDIYGKKYNKEFAFQSAPAINQLINVVEGMFDSVGRAHRPPGYPDIPFEAQTFQLFDHLQETWSDLFSSQQMSHGMQLYCFQPESLWHSDIQDGLPPHTQILPFVSIGTRSARKPCDKGIPPSRSEMVRSTFADSDIGNKGFLTFTDFRSALERCDMNPASCSVEALFTEVDQDCDGHVSYEEWVKFALKPRYGDFVMAMYHRFRDVWTGQRGRPTAQDKALASKREAACALEAEKEAAWHKHRAIAQKRHDVVRNEALIARQQADEASMREQRTYEQLYFGGNSVGRGGGGGGGTPSNAERVSTDAEAAQILSRNTPPSSLMRRG